MASKYAKTGQVFREGVMIGLILRVFVGFVLACLAAGLTTVLFAWSPAELAAMPTDPLDKLALMFPVATHAAIFAAPFALVAIALGEWMRANSWTYYAIAGIVIAAIGFVSQLQSENTTQGWSVVSSNYPAIAFLTTGFVAGFTYWIFSGRFVGQDGRSSGHLTGRPRENGAH